MACIKVCREGVGLMKNVGRTSIQCTVGNLIPGTLVLDGIKKKQIEQAMREQDSSECLSMASATVPPSSSLL